MLQDLDVFVNTYNDTTLKYMIVVSWFIWLLIDVMVMKW